MSTESVDVCVTDLVARRLRQQHYVGSGTCEHREVRYLRPGRLIELVPRPDADSAQEIFDENRWLDEDGMNPVGGLRLDHGMSDARTSMAGDWPDTHLEWTFAFEGCPGLRLRRRVPLFDELGRAVAPEVACVHLVEDLDTRALPPTSDARDGVIDI